MRSSSGASLCEAVPPRARLREGIRGLRPQTARRAAAADRAGGGAGRRPGGRLRAGDVRRGALDRDGDRPEGGIHDALVAGRGDRGMSLATLVLSLADNKQLLGLRYAEWATRAPSLEADIAAAAMGLDDIGHSRVLYGCLEPLGDDPRAGADREGDPSAYL